MKFSSIFALSCAVLPVFGAAIPGEDKALAARNNGAVILSGAVTKVKAAVDRLDKAILTVKDVNFDLILLTTSSQFLLDTLANQTAVAKEASKLDEACADYVQYFVEKLITSVKKLAKDTISKSKIIAASGLVGPLLDIIAAEKDAADTFADVLTGKVPASRTALAKKDKKAVDDAINSIVKVCSALPQ